MLQVVSVNVYLFSTKFSQGWSTANYLSQICLRRFISQPPLSNLQALESKWPTSALLMMTNSTLDQIITNKVDSITLQNNIKQYTTQLLTHAQEWQAVYSLLAQCIIMISASSTALVGECSLLHLPSLSLTITAFSIFIPIINISI